MSHLILCLEQELFSIPKSAKMVEKPVSLPPLLGVLETSSNSSPELEDVFPLLIVVSHLTRSLSQADGHLSVVWNAIACTFSIFIEAKASFS